MLEDVEASEHVADVLDATSTNHPQDAKSHFAVRAGFLASGEHRGDFMRDRGIGPGWRAGHKSDRVAVCRSDLLDKR